MTTIRPNLLPPGGHGPQAQTQDQAKAAATRAFFDAALRQAGGPVQATATTPTTVAAAPQLAVRTAAVPPAEPIQKILRPGSLIDIRV